jgi:hypothetical protein
MITLSLTALLGLVAACGGGGGDDDDDDTGSPTPEDTGAQPTRKAACQRI